MNIVRLIRTYYSFSRKELTNMAFLAIAAAFMISFRDWGGETFDAAAGFRNLFDAFLISALAIVVHESAHKIYALHHGYAAEHKPWHMAVIFGLLLTLVTNGHLYYFGFGVLVYHLAGDRLGRFRYQMNMKDVGLISVAGPLANLLLAIIFKAGYIATGSALAEKAFLINIWFAIFNMLPLPWVDGGNLFFSGRIMYMFFAAFVGVVSLFLFFSESILVPVLMGVIVSAALAIFWAVYFEKIAGD